MPEEMEEFNETNNLYLEILMYAQQLEDKKLIQLITQRLDSIGASPPAAERRCKIIMFPRRVALGA